MRRSTCLLHGYLILSNYNISGIDFLAGMVDDKEADRMMLELRKPKPIDANQVKSKNYVKIVRIYRWIY